METALENQDAFFDRCEQEAQGGAKLVVGSGICAS